MNPNNESSVWGRTHTHTHVHAALKCEACWQKKGRPFNPLQKQRGEQSSENGKANGLKLKYGLFWLAGLRLLFPQRWCQKKKNNTTTTTKKNMWNTRYSQNILFFASFWVLVGKKSTCTDKLIWNSTWFTREYPCTCIQSLSIKCLLPSKHGTSDPVWLPCPDSGPQIRPKITDSAASFRWISENVVTFTPGIKNCICRWNSDLRSARPRMRFGRSRNPVW